MKKTILLLFSLILVCSFAYADDKYNCDNLVCLGDYVINNQADMEAIQDCTVITGDLEIVNADIIDVDELECLNSIVGTLDITGTELTNLDGLSNLKYIGQYLWVTNNNDLEDITGLYNLEGNPSIIQISYNPIKHIDGFNNLKGNSDLILYIMWLAQLESLNGFTSLKSAYHISVIRNVSLESINGFTNLGSCSGTVGDIIIGGSDSIVTVNGFTNVNQVNELSFYRMLNLEEINGFSNLETAELVFIERCDSLYDIDGLSKLDTVDNLDFFLLPSLTQILPVLEKIEHIENVLSVDNTGICEEDIDTFHDSLTTKPLYYINIDNVDCY